MARLRKEGGESEEGRAGFGVGVACETALVEVSSFSSHRTERPTRKQEGSLLGIKPPRSAEQERMIFSP